MRPRRAVASFVGAAAMVLGLLDALGHPVSPSGAAPFVAGVVGYPDTRATLEDAVSVVRRGSDVGRLRRTPLPRAPSPSR